MKHYFVYMMASQRNGTIYIGMTNDLARRTSEHKQKMGGKFTKKYTVNRLVWYETYNNPTDAIRREKQLKKYYRGPKIALIEKDNRNWNDLFDIITQ